MTADPKELERLARKAWPEMKDVLIATEADESSVAEEARLHLPIDMVLVREHERAPEALHAALVVLAGEDKGPAAIVIPADSPVPPVQTGVIIRPLLATCYDEPSHDYERAIRDVVAWLRARADELGDFDRREVATDRRGLAKAIESGAAKGAAGEGM